MTGRHSILALAAAAVCALGAAPAASAAAAVPGPAHPAASGRSPASRTAGVIALPQHPAPRGQRAAQHPLLAKVRGYTASGAPVLAAGAPGGYTAGELRAYLRLSGTGAGQTVAIVDAFDDPYATSDITTYSKQFGLPLPCTRKRTTSCFHFTRLHPFGIGGLDTGWALEESLDIDMVHALAPDASIVLVEARSNAGAALFRALGYAAGLHPTVISNSWTFGGEYQTEASYDHYCQLAATVCTVSAGDTGNPGGYPAYNPAVIAVGGTTLALSSTGKVSSETAWSGSGGGVSAYEPRPAYQDAVNPNPGRGIPDVSFDADPLTGVAIYSAANGGWLQVGGTSVGAPAWAGILAAADQLRAAAGESPLTAAGYEAQTALYGLSTGLHDVTTGSNGGCGAVCTAGPGYDFVTGLGSPRHGIDTALAAAP